ncbi:hypothetical protein SAMD00019534_065980, partial [Acytostelium subglobosum LB1]|uniref:hypothetical protein n=1 Tax=Acytostelium subglobosum LB1 TaxID=1410327 RepID=UPI000644D9AF
NVDDHLNGNLFQVNTLVTVANRSFIVQVDTGSTLMAIPLVNCSSCEDRPADRMIYDPSASRFSKLVKCNSENCLSSGSSRPRCSMQLKETCDFRISYGDGSSVSGQLYEDMVTLAGLSSIAHFGANEYESDHFEYPDADGILGLGRSCKTCVQTVFESIVKNTGVKNIFSMVLNNEGSGAMSMGDINPHFYSGPVLYTPIRAFGPFYTIGLTSFKIGKTSIDPRLFGNVIVDSGSTALTLASGAYDALIKYFMTNLCNIPGVCGYPNIFDGSICFREDTLINSFPILYFTFAGGVVVPVYPINYLIRVPLTSDEVGYCWMIDNGDSDMTILGDVFMRGLHIIFDNESNQVGFSIGKYNNKVINPRMTISKSRDVDINLNVDDAVNLDVGLNLEMDEQD